MHEGPKGDQSSTLSLQIHKFATPQPPVFSIVGFKFKFKFKFRGFFYLGIFGDWDLSLLSCPSETRTKWDFRGGGGKSSERTSRMSTSGWSLPAYACRGHVAVALALGVLEKELSIPLRGIHPLWVYIYRERVSGGKFWGPVEQTFVKEEMSVGHDLRANDGTIGFGPSGDEHSVIMGAGWLLSIYRPNGWHYTAF